MSSFPRFIANLSWSILGKICVQGLLFAVSILVTRYLGKERLGLYATLLVIPAFVRLLNQFGLETLINKKLPELQVQDPGGAQARFLVRRLLGFRVATALAFGGGLYYFFPVYLDWIQRPELLPYRGPVIMYFFAISVNSLLGTLFMTRLRYKVVSLTETVCTLIHLVLLGGVVVWDWGLQGVLYAYVLATGLNILIYLGLARDDWVGEARCPPDRQEMRPLARTSYLITLFSFGLMTQSDVLLMNFYQVDPGRIGFYHLATGLGAMLAFVLTGIGPLALSLFSETYARQGAPGLSRSWCEIVGFAAFFTLPIFVFAFFNARPLITFVYGEAFAGASVALSWYVAFFGLATVLGTDFTVSTLYILDRRDTALKSTLEGSALNVGLNLILIPRYQELGAVVATGTVMGYMVIRQLAVIRRSLEIRPVFRVVGKGLLVALTAAAVTEFAARLLVDQVIWNAGVFGLAFVLILIWMKPFSPDHRRFVAGLYPRLEPLVRLVSTR